MAVYMMEIKYTHDAIKDIAEFGNNREEAVRPLIQKCGGKLLKLLWNDRAGLPHHAYRRI